MILRPVVIAVLISLSLIACSPKQRDSLTETADRFHLGVHSFSITTSNSETQAAFDRGLTLAYAFSHKAAEKEFRRAASLDPTAAMPWWGVALVNGPHINFPLVPEDKAKVAWEALTNAKALASGGTPLEQDLINALSHRYESPQRKDRSKLDVAYANAMKSVASKYPDNADVTTLYAESLMDLHPWDLWKADRTAKPWTPQILQTLERAMKLNNNHPGAHHLYIHAVEASNEPAKGVPSADILRTLVPGAGHLVHMPGHIYVRVGRWEDAAQANINAILADNEFRKSDPQPGFYGIYMLHNHHFLTFVRMMQGQKEEAIKAAKATTAGIPADFLRDFGPIADGYFAILPEVLVRFGEWEQVLAQPEPAPAMPFARSMWRFTRVTALTALNRLEEAKAERALFKDAVRAVPAEATFGNNSAHKLLEIASLVMEGELAAKENRLDDAIRNLQKAANLEDKIMYDEPPDWIIPVRHTLGATLLRAGKAREAEKVYLEDLKTFPANGWSLFGLSRALRLQNRNGIATAIEEEFKREWSASDTKIDASCLCQPGV